MFGSRILETGIGIIFVFTLVSIACTALREGIEAWLKTRAAHLEHGLCELLNDPTGKELVKKLFDHPQISGLFPGSYEQDLHKRRRKTGKKPSAVARGHNLPSYIPTRNFALALMDIAARGPADKSDVPLGPISLTSIRSNLEANIPDVKIRRVLLTAMDTAQGDLNLMRRNIEQWYDSSMDRVSGWYKRSTQTVLFILGLTIAIVLNINTITIADYLYRNDAARAAVVLSAQSQKSLFGGPQTNPTTINNELDSLGLPIGWTDGWGAPRRTNEPGYSHPWNQYVGPLLGWLMTALAATLGAPFWFDLLNKMMVIRSTVKPHEKSPEEASQDHQDSRHAPIFEAQSRSPEGEQLAEGDNAEGSSDDWI